MKTIYLMMVTLLFTGLSLTNQAQTTKAEPDKNLTSADKIDVFYFHNTRRCQTCKAVEAVTRKTLEDNFSGKMKNGELTFQSLNMEEEVNEPLARKLHVSGQTLLFVKNGKKKDLTNEAFMYARSNPEKLQEKIVRTIENL